MNATRPQSCGSIAFPNIAASLGGAVRVDYTPRLAFVYLPGDPVAVKLKRSELPPLDDWTAFNLADACKR